MDRLRVDKWLWAARFFKTRSIAKTAIEGGKVHLSGQRVKVSREICVGEKLVIKQGWDEREIIVKALSDKRGPASVSQEERAKRRPERRQEALPHGRQTSQENTNERRSNDFENNSIFKTLRGRSPHQR